MIPKIIHYCWFGGNCLPANTARYIESWKMQCPDYEIVEWNESNFDIKTVKYAEQAYQAKKYAFVSDVVRVYALAHYGGIYLDTDVEVLQSFDGVLDHGCVFGFEYKNWIATSFMAAEKEHPLMIEFWNLYQKEIFLDDTGRNLETNVERITKMLVDRGLKRNNMIQNLKDNIIVYPKEYFSPYDYGNCVMEKTEKTICVHYFAVSWMPWIEREKKAIKHILVKVIGKRNLVRLRNLVRNQHEME